MGMARKETQTRLMKWFFESTNSLHDLRKKILSKEKIKYSFTVGRSLIPD